MRLDRALWRKLTLAACTAWALSSIFSTHAAAQETYLVLNGLTYHSNTAAGFNEHNFGLGLAHRDGPCGAEAGFYKNSFSATSVYGLAFCETDGHIRTGVWASLASNYPFANNTYGVAPFAGVQVAIGQLVIRATNANGLVLFAHVRVPLR